MSNTATRTLPDYVFIQGDWVIGIVEEVDEVTGEASSLKTVCSSFNNLNDRADKLSGPTDPQLNGVWRCKFIISLACVPTCGRLLSV